jgi:hypothetical protein
MNVGNKTVFLTKIFMFLVFFSQKNKEAGKSNDNFVGFALSRRCSTMQSAKVGTRGNGHLNYVVNFS